MFVKNVLANAQPQGKQQIAKFICKQIHFFPILPNLHAKKSWFYSTLYVALKVTFFPFIKQK